MCFVVIQFFQTRRAGERAHHNGWLPVPVVAFFTALLLLAGGLQAATFDTPVTVSSLDFSAYAQWVDGAETTATNLSDPTRVLYTQTTVPNFNGYGFGESTNPGPRHLRIGFTAPMAVGSVLVRGSGKLSVLASNAPYPGNLTNESHWLPAQRLTTALGITANEVPDNGYAIWVLPPGTTTRALRFSHTSAVSDPAYVGRAAGAWLLTNRFANLAPQAPILTSTNQALAGRINNETDEMFNAWDNGFNGGTNVVSTTNFEWVILTWPTNISLNGLCALWAGFSEGTVQNYSGPANIHPRNADESMWTTLVASTNIQNQYPWFLPPNFLDFGSNVTTRALRLKITKAINEATSHAGLAGSSRAGKRVWLGDLLALAPLGTNDLASAVVPHVTLQPPIPVPFFLSQPGYVTLVIEDAAGKRVRNLVGETFFPAGTNLVYWDGLDESGKVDTGQHGEYAVQGALVPAGNYKVRGLQRDAIDLRYEFSVYHNGNPPWITANDTGGWLADHTPPSDVAFLPGATNEVLISSFIAEDGAGFVWVDLNGRRTHSRKWVGGTFTGATHLSRDRGAQRNTNHMVYSGSAWEGALRLYGLMTNG
ncbi:MAG: hypothetical protein HY301_03480 [Verrucomicrobia bacterium]|nr:hypothetical protein [Verrucomicrobiota bacterium]